MRYPNLNEEKKLWKSGYKYVVGLDEAGRGPLAGPVVAGAVMLKNYKFQISNFKFLKEMRGVKDSKKLSARKREEIYEVLTNHPAIEWGVGRVSEKIIDKINILEATKLAMIIAIKKFKVDFLIIDGNFKIKKDIPQKSIIKADAKVFSCAAASIIAKVTRDRIMEKEHRKYPKYNFAKHKGYPTKEHYKAIRKNGCCKIHRKTFRLEN